MNQLDFERGWVLIVYRSFYHLNITYCLSSNLIEKLHILTVFVLVY